MKTYLIRNGFVLIMSSMLISALLFTGCKKDEEDEGGPLTPARSLEGTWKTPFPVKFFIKTDFCSVTPELVASQDRMVTMIMKEAGDYQVDITITYTDSNFTVLNPNCNPTGYVPDVSPNYLHGDVSGTQLMIFDSEHHLYGSFTFTTDLMEGTWSDTWCIGYCQSVYTDTNTLKLTLQH